MTRDLSEWANLAERAARENAAYEELAAWQGAMAAVLRAADATHYRFGSSGECVCGRQWPCSELDALYNALVPLTPFYFEWTS